MTQVPGDPPITIGDGSFHAHSVLDWISPDLSNGMIIRPKATSGNNPGSFSAGGPCGFTDKNKTFHNASAFLWTDEENLYDISPVDLSKWSVTITHTNHVVTIRVVGGYLQIASDSGGTFDAGKTDDEGDRRLSPAGKVTSIVVSNAKDNTGWPTASPHHPHYTIGICYQ